MRGLFRVVRTEERWLLLTPSDGAAETLRRLKMFVLRSAVAIVPADGVAVGAVIDAGPAWLAAHALPAGAPPGAAFDRSPVRLVHGGGGYWLAVGPPAAVDSLDSELPRAPATAAALAEVGLGIPAVTGPLADQYVAQMLNLDELGALSFDKGCYPGQEIIARVRHLGSVKRRVRRYGLAAPPPGVGSDVALADGTSVGAVVRAAPAEGGSEVLAVVEHSAAGAPLQTGGVPLRELPLPFAVPAR